MLIVGAVAMETRNGSVAILMFEISFAEIEI